jgi:DNA polymerase-1
MRAVPGVAWTAPVAIDAAAWNALADEAAAERTRLAGELDALAPSPTGLPGMAARNWDSPDDVKAALAAVGVTVESTADGVLAALDHPLAALLRDYRSVGKLADTYGREWLAKANPRNGRVLTAWNQLGADSGRMSSSSPNLQNLPRDLRYRRCFVAGPGRVLVKADYSQIELRIAAKVADEDRMIAAFREGRDLHNLTAAAILGKPESDVTKADRPLAKVVNFGLLYGMGWRGLRDYARKEYGVKLTDAQARGYREAFFKAYPGLRRWHDRVGSAVKTAFNRDPNARHDAFTVGRRRLSLAVGGGSKENRFPNVSEALNHPVQGTAADGFKAAVGLLWERRAECPSAVPVLFVHDEIVVECDAGEAEKAEAWLRAAMLDGMAPFADPVPVEVEVGTGRTWAVD